MTAQYKNFRKPIAEVAILGVVLATLSWMLNGAAPGCRLLDKAAWVALEVLRPVVMTAWQTTVSYLCEDSGFLGHALQIVASQGSLLSLIAGLV
jgi:hypothetical protein